MIRIQKIKKKVNAILTADWHLREDTPVCWVGDFQKQQWLNVKCIDALQKEYNCPVLHGGDLFNHWKPSPWLLSETIKHLPAQFYTAYGNHDLPQHNLELANKCGIYTLEKAGKINTEAIEFDIYHWNEIPYQKNLEPPAVILLWHKFVYQGKIPFPGAEGDSLKILKKYKESNLIITGDNHTPFVEEYKGRLLVNPGPLMIQKASEVDLPRVYLWHAEDNTVTSVYLPWDNSWVTEAHLDKEKQRENRITSFISRLDTEFKATMSFEDNLKLFERKNKVNQKVMQIVYKSLGQ